MIYEAKGFANRGGGRTQGTFDSHGNYVNVDRRGAALNPIVALKNFVAGVAFLLGLLKDRRD